MQPAQRRAKDGVFFSGAEGSSLRLSGSFRKIERELLNLLAAEEYEKIKIMLGSTSPDAKESFFKKHGNSILNYAVNKSNNTEALKIIMENIPATIVQSLLRHNDFEILKGLVAIEYALENYVLPGQTEEEGIQGAMLFREKLRFLSRVDNKLLGDFLKEHPNEKYMSESVVQMIESVIQTSNLSAQRIMESV